MNIFRKSIRFQKDPPPITIIGKRICALTHFCKTLYHWNWSINKKSLHLKYNIEHTKTIFYETSDNASFHVPQPCC